MGKERKLLGKPIQENIKTEQEWMGAKMLCRQLNS